MKGHVESRRSVGAVTFNRTKCQSALKDFLISAKMGFKPSLDSIKEMKTQYAKAERLPRRVGGNEEPLKRRREDRSDHKVHLRNLH